MLGLEGEQEGVYRTGDLFGFVRPFHTARTDGALIEFDEDHFDGRAAFLRFVVCVSVQGDVSDDSAQKSDERIRSGWRYGIPYPQISVVHAFGDIFIIRQNVARYRCAVRTVFN